MNWGACRRCDCRSRFAIVYFNYLKSRVFHLIVLPELLARKDDTLTQAAPQPIQFQAKVGNTFQLGATEPAIRFSAGVQATIRGNATPGSSLFDQDTFVVKAAAPAPAMSRRPSPEPPARA